MLFESGILAPVHDGVESRLIASRRWPLGRLVSPANSAATGSVAMSSTGETRRVVVVSLTASTDRLELIAGRTAGLVSLLYEVADDRDLPEVARGEESRMAWRLRARHRLREPETAVDRAGDGEMVAVLRRAARRETG